MDEPVWSVTDVNAAVRDLLENSFMPFWISGEIGTLTKHSSGHVYLVLKDAQCQLRATWFGGGEKAAELGLRIGDKVEAFGKLSCYPARGEYQFNIRTMRPAGLGNLLLEFEKIKKKLEAEGLFAPERKRRLPEFPRSIGVITAREGAALRDFLKIALADFPAARIRIYPAAMQGANAVREVCRGLDFFNASDDVELIVITRGGGSIEDLWPFNSEPLARKVAASRLAVVSAIGHEIDFTICDFVSDLRCATPTAAAEAVFGGYRELLNRLRRAQDGIRGGMLNRLALFRSRLERAGGHYALREPRHLVELKQQQLDEIDRRQSSILTSTRDRLTARLSAAAGRLAALSPRNVLERGYSMVRDENGRIITEASTELLEKIIITDLANGSISSKVNKIIGK